MDVPPRVCRCVASAPLGDWKATTFVAGLRHHQLTAPMVADGPMDGEMFLAWVEQFLCPTFEAGGYRHPRQSQQPQGGRGQTSPRCGWRYSALSAALFARPESHRKVLCKTQDTAPQGRQAIHRRPMEGDRRAPRHHLSDRMRQLLRFLRICKHLNYKCSKLSRAYGAGFLPAHSIGKNQAWFSCRF